jgi:hypothetical protein
MQTTPPLGEYVLRMVLPQMPFHETSTHAGMCECRKLEGPETQLAEPMNTGSFPVLRYNMENARPQLAELRNSSMRKVRSSFR